MTAASLRFPGLSLRSLAVFKQFERAKKAAKPRGALEKDN